MVVIDLHTDSICRQRGSGTELWSDEVISRLLGFRTVACVWAQSSIYLPVDARIWVTEIRSAFIQPALVSCKLIYYTEVKTSRYNPWKLGTFTLLLAFDWATNAEEFVCYLLFLTGLMVYICNYVPVVVSRQFLNPVEYAAWLRMLWEIEANARKRLPCQNSEYNGPCWSLHARWTTMVSSDSGRGQVLLLSP